MANVILDSMVRIPEDETSIRLKGIIRRELRLKIPAAGWGFGDEDSGPKSVKAYKVENGYFCLPRQWDMSLSILAKNQVTDHRAHGEPVDLKWLGSFRTGQEKFVRALVDGVRANGHGGIGKAGCGFGKTVTACSVIAELNTTTIVLVHKSLLVRQWQAACRKFLGIEPGIIRGELCDFRGKKVVIGMFKSLFMRDDYPPDLFKSFGLVITDECHHVAARTFWDVVTKFPAKYQLGLSATPRRGDRLEKIFFWTIGPVMAVGKGQTLNCQVSAVNYRPDEDYDERDFEHKGKPNLGKLINCLVRDGERTSLICRIITKAAKAGRKLLVLTDRIEHIEDMQTRLERRWKLEGLPFTVDHYASGDTKKILAQQERAAACTVCLATYPMANEALDIPDLDTLLMATPKADIEQAVGRIRRLLEGKKVPHIVDIQDKISFLHGLNTKRLNFCRKERWPIREVTAYRVRPKRYRSRGR